jgi:hypothetical protein
MRYEYDADLHWSKGISNSHKIDLAIGLQLAEFLTGKNIATELAMNQSNIRYEIKRVVVEEILPKMLSDIAASPVDGELKSSVHSTIKGNARTREIRTPQGIDLQVRDRMSITMNITTDRQVTALQALVGSNLIVAEAITNDIMMHLKHQYFGVTNHDISSRSSQSDGKLAKDTARHKGDAAN